MKFLIVLMLGWAVIANAGVFDDPKNLKVLDEDVTPTELRKTMRGFAMGLGVRCTHCHVGEEGQPLTTFDFASDEKSAKVTARMMMKMVNTINLKHLEPLENNQVQVECMTCHRGAKTPILTTDLLHQTYAEKGVDGALGKHTELRQQYFGSHTHDFTERTLLTLAEMIGFKDAQAVEKVLETNLDLYPKSTQTLITLGQFHRNQKSFGQALKYLKQANELQPNSWLAQQIKVVEAEQQ